MFLFIRERSLMNYYGVCRLENIYSGSINIWTNCNKYRKYKCIGITITHLPLYPYLHNVASSSNAVNAILLWFQGAVLTMENVTPEVLIEALRSQCLQKGCGGIKGLGIVFKNMDIDYSKRIVYEELKIGVQRYGIRMSENYLRNLFEILDKDNSGGIDFLEFMKALRPPMKQIRIELISEVFESLDLNRDGVLNADDIKGSYNTMNRILSLNK